MFGPSQPGVIPSQNTQDQSTWLPGTHQDLTLGLSANKDLPSNPRLASTRSGFWGGGSNPFGTMGGQQNPGDAMAPPQPQPNQNDILAPPSTLQSFAELPIPPLDRMRFQGSYRNFCSTKKLAIHEAALDIGGKQVNLHTLHEEVLKLHATGQVSLALPHPELVCLNRGDSSPPIFGTLLDRNSDSPLARSKHPMRLPFGCPLSTSNSSTNLTPSTSPLFFRSPTKGTCSEVNRSLKTVLWSLSRPH